MKRILVAGSGGPAGVNFSRSLNEAPEDIYMLGTDSNPYHLYLAEVDKKALVPKATPDEEAYVAALNELVETYELTFLHPQTDVEVRVLSKHRDVLKAPTFLPSREAVEVGQNKLEANRIWQKAGIPVPETFLVRNSEDLKAAFERLQTPIWIRSIFGGGGRGSLSVKKMEHAEAWIDYWEGWGRFSASEFLPGDNLTWLCLWKDGELVCSQGRQRLEYIIPEVSPSGVTGTPAVSRTISRDDVNEIGEKAVLAIDRKPNGVYFVDLKCNRRGVPCVTEINLGRFNTTVYFYTRAGVNFPRIFLSLAYDEPTISVPRYNALPPDYYWIRTIDCGPVLLRL